MVETRQGAASKGFSLGTTAAVSPLMAAGKLNGPGYLTLTGTTYSTAVVARFAVNPWVTVLTTTNNMTTFTDASDNAQDGSTSTDITLSSLPSSAAGGRIYLGSAVPVRGWVADVDAVNGTASVSTGEYWNGSAWTDLSITDGTASGGATWAVDGTITFAVPAAWASDSLVRILGLTGKGPRGGTNAILYEELFWARLNATVAFDSATTLNSLMPLNRSTNYAEIAASLPTRVDVKGGVRGDSCIEALVDAGTGLLLIDVTGNFAA